MAKVLINSFLILSRRRSYASVVENVREQGAATAVMRKAAGAAEPVAPASSGVVDEKKETFWMRDPNTGNWIPESHFGEVDVAEQREKLLAKKNKL
ncbi:Late embryogenesis abundant protein [Parasponia andersonii]|uniref:Late embryogenesis abundant protein n=1 Tax=Parasponia andersonii TaxID=3476 RepID=A0A2P5CPZ8_PARAD|nr:Late embryogenesis abundant protein [Parasponia andersonii]